MKAWSSRKQTSNRMTRSTRWTLSRSDSSRSKRTPTKSMTEISISRQLSPNLRMKNRTRSANMSRRSWTRRTSLSLKSSEWRLWLPRGSSSWKKARRQLRSRRLTGQSLRHSSKVSLTNVRNLTAKSRKEALNNRKSLKSRSESRSRTRVWLKAFLTCKTSSTSWLLKSRPLRWRKAHKSRRRTSWKLSLLSSNKILPTRRKNSSRFIT